MGSKARDDIAELTDDILKCRELWALMDKWLGAAKGFRLGQITYRIFAVAREIGNRGKNHLLSASLSYATL